MFRCEERKTELGKGTSLFVTKKYVPLRKRVRVIYSDSDLTDEMMKLSMNLSPELITTRRQSRQQKLSTVNNDLMEEILLRMNVSKGGRTTKMIIGSKTGHILKTDNTRSELAIWVYQKFGNSLEENISCSSDMF